MGNNSSCRQGPCLNHEQKTRFSQSAVIEVYSNKFFVKGDLNFNKQSTFKKLQIAANQLCLSSGIGSEYMPLVMRLLAFKHDNVFQAFSTLNGENRIQFIGKICEIHLDLMDSLYQFLVCNENRNQLIKKLKSSFLSPFQGLQAKNIKIEDKLDLVSKGVSLLRTSKVAIVFMCAGASSRFFFQDKFLHPLEINNQQTTLLKVLFQKLRENYRPNSKQQIIDLPIILVGNETNTDLIESYLKENDFFNFNRMNIYFSTVPSLPILDSNGKICLNFEYNYLRRPKGSACCIEELLNPQARQVLSLKKVKYVHMVGTENLGQSPGDPLSIGLTDMLKRKVSIKCVSPTNSLEKFDRIISCNDGVRIIDQVLLEEINLKQLYESNIAMNSMIFSLDSVDELVQRFNNGFNFVGLYRSLAIKQNLYDFDLRKPLLNRDCWAFQKDIRDIISCADQFLVLKVEREEFIPLISPRDQYSIEQAISTYMSYHGAKTSRFQSPFKQSSDSFSMRQKYEKINEYDQTKKTDRTR